MRNRILFNQLKWFRLRILLLSASLIFIGNYLSAQVAGDYRSNSLLGNWDLPIIWQKYDGTTWLPAADYPGQNPGVGTVTIQDGNIITLNVSPANAVGSLAIQGGALNTLLVISAGFTLNVTGLVQINPPTSGTVVGKAIAMNGAAAQLNCASLTLGESGNDTWGSALGFNGGGTINVSGNLNASAANPVRTQIGFNGGGTLSVSGDITGGQITVGGAGGTSTLGIGGIASTVGNLVMIGDATSILDLNGNLSVSGTLTLTAGKIDIGPNLFALSNANPATQLVGGSATSYGYTTSEFGRLIRLNLAAPTPYTFPVGTPTDYLPVITSTAAGASSFAISAYSPAATNATVGGPQFGPSVKLRIVDAMWYIDRTVGAGNSTLTIQWTDGLEGATFAGLGNAQIGISRHNGLSWDFPPIQTSGDNGTNIVTATFNNTFGAFGIADIGQALPVKFGPIKAYEKQNGIQLDWKVYSENKVKNYEIERSSDARIFTSVGSLPALYNNITDGDYGFFDANPLQGTIYYRIKNNDLDGKSAYSVIVRVNRNKTIKGLSLYPNPVANGIVLLQGSDLGRGNYKINIFGANGQEIYKQQIKHNGGTISQTIQLPSTISKGVYMLSVKDENGNIIFKEKLIKQ
jgi:hypothetical protein